MSGIPIYKLDLSAAAWRIHWWLFKEMDENKVVGYNGWQRKCSEEVGLHYVAVSRSIKALKKSGLIEPCPPGRRSVRVVIERLTV